MGERAVKRWATAILVVTSLFVAAGYARAETMSALRLSSGWSFGSLDPVGAPLVVPGVGRLALSGLLDTKNRIGATPLSGGAALISPWIGRGAASDTAASGLMSGFLIDVPIGAFRITPSIGAGMTGRSAFGEKPSLEIRSQLELGYEFENQSSISLGISRSSDTVSRGGGSVEEAFGFRYRLPFGR